MNFLRIVSIVFGAAGLAVGVYAASIWKKASEVTIIPLYAQLECIEPLDRDVANTDWIIGITNYAKTSGELNRRAAQWTAVAVFLSSLAGFGGLF